MLVLSLRNWRPLVPVLIVFGLAISWNVTPLAISYVRSAEDPAAHASYWQPAVSYLHGHLTPSYRVEAVDTAGHWAALYLPRAGIPLARGWFRQDDFPQNELLYDRLGPQSYLRWLRSMGVRYVAAHDARARLQRRAPRPRSSAGRRSTLAAGPAHAEPDRLRGSARRRRSSPGRGRPA